MEILQAQDLKEAISLLKQASLPTEDIGDHVELFVLKNDEQTLGTIGYETDGKTGLLRSLSIVQSHRNSGYGTRLVAFLEEQAKRKKLEALYLLTTTAAPFFSQHGYTIIHREEAPAFIQQSPEFVSLCPSSAVVMKKALA